MFIRHVLFNRHHASHIAELNLCAPRNLCVSELVEYAVLHNSIEYLSLDLAFNGTPYKLSTLSSKSLKKLTFQVEFEELEELASETDCWDLPALTTLHLKHQRYDLFHKLPDLCLTCLPALRTLSIDDWILTASSFSFSLPYLTTLCLSWCKLPQMVWDFPALTSLDLYYVNLPINMSDIFTTLVNLQSLRLFLGESLQRDLSIPCPQLLNLTIRAACVDPPSGFAVLAPKLQNFNSVGIFTITFGVHELENVNIKFSDWVEKWRHIFPMKKYNERFTIMLPGLGIAKNLTFDLESFQALSEISILLANLPSPFFKLKYVRLPRGYKESSVPSALRSYLLGASPSATFVTTLPQNNMVPQSAAVSVTAGKAVLQEPFATVEGTNNDRMSFSKGNGDFGLWRGHEVNSEYVSLLDRIMHKYPETFEHFTTENKKLCTMRLNMLCTSLNDFSKISMREVDSETIAEYRNVFAFLENLGFNLSWVLNRLNYIRHHWFSKPLKRTS